MFIEIPDNPTNRDVVMHILSDYQFEDMGDTIIAERFDPYCHLQFSREWLDAPFEECVCIMDEDETESETYQAGEIEDMMYSCNIGEWEHN